MTASSLLASAAVLFSSALALAAVVRKSHSLASWCFAVGMGALAVESGCDAASEAAVLPERIIFWQTFATLAKCALPGVWLCFSLTYARGNYRAFLIRSRFILTIAALLPIVLMISLQTGLMQIDVAEDSGQVEWTGFAGMTKVLESLLLLFPVLILTNIEKTFRAAVGTTRWRIKFLVLGLAVVFGARLYTQSQALLFSGHNLALTSVETGALLIGCLLMAVAYLRSGLTGMDIYPSHAVLRSSITVLLVGGYLFIVGVLAQIITYLGKAVNFQAQALVVLLGIALLAVLLLSDRARESRQRFISRHFQRQQYDFQKIWTLFTQRTSRVVDEVGLCSAAAGLISETFNVLSVTIWLVEERRDQLIPRFSTSQPQTSSGETSPGTSISNAFLSAVRRVTRPFDLDTAKGEWANPLREYSPGQFRKGGSRCGVPLLSGDRWLGVIILADRVNGVPYTGEELDLLKCVGDQFASCLLNLRLTGELMAVKELEAFQTMSAFFVHDLKNAVSGLNLMLQNLPVHFDDPAFRADALRGIASTVDRINHLIGRLSVLRNKLELKLADADINDLITGALKRLNGTADVEVVADLPPLPRARVDHEQFQSVIENLLLNARDAVGRRGRIKVETSQRDNRLVVSIADNGCGMSPAFLRDSLFRPFHSTKKKGLGIGMFQSKMIVEAHRGQIQVESETGIGTTFRIILPAGTQTV